MDRWGFLLVHVLLALAVSLAVLGVAFGSVKITNGGIFLAFLVLAWRVFHALRERGGERSHNP